MFGTAANYNCPGPTEAHGDTAAQRKMDMKLGPAEYDMACFPD
jgi:hypothetical protein